MHRLCLLGEDHMLVICSSLNCLCKSIFLPKWRRSLLLPERERLVIPFGAAMLALERVRTVRCGFLGGWEAKGGKLEWESRVVLVGVQATRADG